MEILLNDKVMRIDKPQTILELASANGVFIPTLCHYPGLDAAGMCRLCVVEIYEGRKKEGRLVTSCNYPLRNDVKINTESDRVLQGRKLILELLYSRCPDSEKIRELGILYKANFERFSINNQDCILCGLCARICEKVGGNILSLSGRGVEIHVSTPFNKVSSSCIGCLSCVNLCPVHKITYEDIEGERNIVFRNNNFSQIRLRKCLNCGVFFGPIIDLFFINTRANKIEASIFDQNICSQCARMNLGMRLAERYLEQFEYGERGY